MQQILQNPKMALLLLIAAAVLLVLLVVAAVCLILSFIKSRRLEKRLSAMENKSGVINKKLQDIGSKIEQERKPSERFRAFANRLRENGVPQELLDPLEELNDAVAALEAQLDDNVKTYHALVQSLEAKVKLIEVSYQLSEKKIAAFLIRIIADLKKSSKKLVDKHAENLFKKLERLEREVLGGLEERMTECETALRVLELMKEPDYAEKVTPGDTEEEIPVS